MGGLQSGLVIGNPVPENLAADTASVERATTAASAAASSQNIRGRETTPFLLKTIHNLTGGESVRANIELIKHNALVGARIAAGLNSTSPGADWWQSCMKRKKCSWWWWRLYKWWLGR